jgi:hypothetical protein
MWNYEKCIDTDILVVGGGSAGRLVLISPV